MNVLAAILVAGTSLDITVWLKGRSTTERR